MTKLSVNINKIATLRNARGGNIPDVIRAAVDIQSFGAEGITVHPRPDGRHIRYSDVRDLRRVVHTEFNVEGFPADDFLDLVEEVLPEQVTLVPDPPNVLTSQAGWDCLRHYDFLVKVIRRLKSQGMRVSLFVEPSAQAVAAAAETGTNRIELYTENYARAYPSHPDKAIQPYLAAANEAIRLNLGVNAGHDLNLDNLRYFSRSVPGLLEVSIGHALISDALYYGLEKTVQRYLSELKGTETTDIR